MCLYTQLVQFKLKQIDNLPKNLIPNIIAGQHLFLGDTKLQNLQPTEI